MTTRTADFQDLLILDCRVCVCVCVCVRVCVVSSANLMMVLVGWVGVESWVYKEYSSGLSTQPCGEPVLSVMVEERWGPSFTVCGRFVRKSFIQVQMEGERPSAVHLLTSMSGMIVLNAEL